MNTSLTPQANFSIEEIIQSLEALLEKEFDLLRTNQSVDLEKIQLEKSNLLDLLSKIFMSTEGKNNNGELFFPQQIQNCKNLHRRNELFLKRKLNAIQCALDSLQLSHNHSVDPTYDRKGLVKRRWL